MTTSSLRNASLVKIDYSVFMGAMPVAGAGNHGDASDRGSEEKVPYLVGDLRKGNGPKLILAGLMVWSDARIRFT
jgi:hypothetical protein